jgi:hypothetical protein
MLLRCAIPEQELLHALLITTSQGKVFEQAGEIAKVTGAQLTGWH